MTEDSPSGPFLFRLTVEHTPSPDDPKEADDFYKAIGVMVVAWGRLEGHFVTALLTIMAIAYPQLGGKLPMTWKDRIAMWRQAFDRLPILAPFKEIAMQFLGSVEKVALDRHAIVHALWENFSDTDPMTIGAVIIKRRINTDDGLDIKRANISVEAIRTVGRQADALNIRLTPLTEFLTEYRSRETPPPADIRIV